MSLYQIRRDLKPIIEIMKAMNYRNCYDNGGGQWWKDDKEAAFTEGCAMIKALIVELAEKYKEEE